MRTWSVLSGAYGALEAVVAEVTAGLDGDDPLEPMSREAVTQIGTDLAALWEHAEGLVGVEEVLCALVFEA